MTQNFDDQQLQDLEDSQDNEFIDDEFWKNYYDSQREEEAIIEHYDKIHNQ
jgi:hypothetical protein